MGKIVGTIKKKDLQALRRDLLEQYADNFCLMIDLEDWRNRLWDAEQEIHDLKYEMENHFAANSALAEENAELLMENALLHKTLELTSRHLFSKIFEQTIEPPACLKPLDTLYWVARTLEG